MYEEDDERGPLCDEIPAASIESSSYDTDRTEFLRCELTYVCIYLNSALFIISNDVPLFEVFHHKYGFLKCSPLI